MADVQDVLDRCEVLDNELQFQSGESQVPRGITAINMAQDYFESLIAEYPGLMGDKSGTITTTASTETTTFPTGLLRLDSLWYVDPTDSLPRWKLQPVYGSGAHRENYIDPVHNLMSGASVTGRPRAYWTDGTNIYWTPTPDGTHTVRWYGFQIADKYTAAGNTFAYPDMCMGPFAAFVTRVMELGVDDPDAQYSRLANELFGPVIRTMQNFRREGPRPIRTANS